MEKLQLKKGVKEEDCRWQWKGRLEWLCFSDANSTKCHQAFLLDKAGVDIWDGPAMRELDFVNMRALPGRQPLRFAPPPPPLGAPPLKRNPLPKKETTWELTVGLKSNDGEMIQPDGLKAITHPCFLSFENPHFIFADGPENEYQHFIWERKLGTAENGSEFIVYLSEIYAEVLDREDPHLPMFGNPSQTMAALALALYRAGARSCLDDRFWWLSRKNADVANPLPLSPNGSTWGREKSSTRKFSPPMLPSPTLSPKAPSKTSPQKNILLNTATQFPALSKSMSTGSVLSKTMPPLNTAFALGVPSQYLAYHETKPKPPLRAHSFITFRLQDRTLSLKLIKAWQEWRAAALASTAVGVSRVPMLDPVKLKRRTDGTEEGDFKWIAETNDLETRLIRIGCACTTLWHATLNESVLGCANRISLLSSDSKDSGQPATFEPHVRVTPGLSSVEIAMKEVRAGRRVAAALLCDKDRMGGDFMFGICSGLQEDLLMRSDLYQCLVEAEFQAEVKKFKDTEGHLCHIPDDGALCCADVRIFRDTKETGFRLLEEPVVLPVVICMTLRNLNPYLNCAADHRMSIHKFDRAQYELTLKSKFEMLLQGANDYKVERLAISDQGCANLHNDGEMLGRALGKALLRARTRPPMILVSGTSRFISALKKTVSDK